MTNPWEKYGPFFVNASNSGELGKVMYQYMPIFQAKGPKIWA